MTAYFKHFSKLYDIQTLVKMNSYLTCKELHDLDEMAHFPLDISKVDFIKFTVDDDGYDADVVSLVSNESEFFRTLLTPETLPPSPTNFLIENPTV